MLAYKTPIDDLYSGDYQFIDNAPDLFALLQKANSPELIAIRDHTHLDEIPEKDLASHYVVLWSSKSFDRSGKCSSNLYAIPQSLPSTLQTQRLSRIIQSYSMHLTQLLEYITIPDGLIRAERHLDYPLYVRVGERFIVFMEKGHIIDQESMARLEDKGKNNIFLAASDYEDFLFVQDANCRKVMNGFASGPQMKLDVTTRSFPNTMRLIGHLGVTERNLELVTGQIDMALDSILEVNSSSAGIADLLSNLRRGDYIYEHSMMTAILGGLLVKQMGMDPETVGRKIAIAAFLHDAGVKEGDEYRDQVTGKASIPDESEFWKHALRSKELAKAIPTLPSDVDRIIQDHHECPSGEGGPRGIGASQFTPLSMLFNIVHEFVIRSYPNHLDEQSMVEALKSMDPYYNKDQFQKPFSLLKEILVLPGL